MNKKDFFEELIRRLEKDKITGELEHRKTHDNPARKKKKVLAWDNTQNIDVAEPNSIAVGNLYDYADQQYELGWFDSGFTYNTAIEITDDEADILVNQLGLTEITYKNRKDLRRE